MIISSSHSISLYHAPSITPSLPLTIPLSLFLSLPSLCPCLSFISFPLSLPLLPSLSPHLQFSPSPFLSRSLSQSPFLLVSFPFSPLFLFLSLRHFLYPSLTLLVCFLLSRSRLLSHSSLSLPPISFDVSVFSRHALVLISRARSPSHFIFLQ